MKDTDTIGVADGEGQDMGEAQTEACVPVSELRDLADEWSRYADERFEPYSPEEERVAGEVKTLAEELTELADKYDSNE